MLEGLGRWHLDEEQVVANYEELRHYANKAVWTIHLQIERLREPVGDDDPFVLRPISEFEWLVIQLDRLLSVARRVSKLSGGAQDEAITLFEDTIPKLRDVRNVVAHIDEYAVGRGNKAEPKPGTLACHLMGQDTFNFAGFPFNLNVVAEVSDKLFDAIKEFPPALYTKAVDES